MNLSSFKRLVDDDKTPIEGDFDQDDEESILAQIRDCFTPKEIDVAFSYIREVITDLGLRYICDDSACEPYLKVAEAIQWALRKNGRSVKRTSDWAKAVTLARKHAAMRSFTQPMDMRWNTDVRVSTLSSAITALRDKGYGIQLPPEGGVIVPPNELERLINNIHILAKSLGRGLATSAAGAMGRKWSPFTGRFNLGRSGQQLQIGATPQVPLGYLYQLGLRYFQSPPSTTNPEANLDELTNLLTNATGLLDLVTGPYDLMFARINDVLAILRKSTIYDSVFIVTQAKVEHVQEFVEWMMQHISFASLESKSGATAKQVLTIAQMLLDACKKTHPSEFCEIQVHAVALASNQGCEPAARLLKEVFCHHEGVNQKLSFPPKDTDVDSAFRPLVVVNGVFILQPPPMAGRAILNAATDWCRCAWPNKKFDEEALGPMLEEFIRHKLSVRGVNVLHGKYKQAGTEGECDAVIETEKELIFLELKSKMLRREGKAGNDLVAVADLGQALVRPQAQAIHHHAALLKSGSLTLQAKSGGGTITLTEREVLKVSITRGDLGSLHDRIFLQQFLRAGSIANFDAVDSKNQSKLKELKHWFDRLKAAARSVGEADFHSTFPYSRSWSLSVFQLLLLLEHTVDNDSFSRELQRTRRIVTSMRDFYEEYAYAYQQLGNILDGNATSEL